MIKAPGDVPTDLPRDIAELEHWFARHQISKRHLRPRWMTLCRWMGLDPKPPLYFSLGEHFRWEGLPGLGIVLLAYLAVRWGLDIRPQGLVYVAVIVAGGFPLFNWTIRRRIRWRLAQEA